MRLALHAFLSLDGVMQSPGGPDEDREGSFPHGGWTFPYGDQEFGATMVKWIEESDGLLLGRKTYDIFSGFWPNVTDPTNPIATKFNGIPKYVVSHSEIDLPWNDSILISGDVVAKIKELKALSGNEIQVHGSSNLAQTLMENELIDVYRLLYFPVHLGQGKKLFRDGLKPAALRPVELMSTGSGVTVGIYEPDGPVRYGSFAD